MNTPHKKDGLIPALPETPTIPSHIDRRTFLMRNAVIGAAAVMTSKTWTAEARAEQAAKESGKPKLGATLSPDLDVVVGKSPMNADGWLDTPVGCCRHAILNCYITLGIARPHS